MITGGKREGAGRKPLPPDTKKNKLVLYVNLFEKTLLLEHLEELRKDNNHA